MLLLAFIKAPLLIASLVRSTLMIFYYLEELRFVHKSRDFPWYFFILIP